MTSSLRDGISYAKLYACGDPKMSLADWLKDYFTPARGSTTPKENFQTWKPGETWDYCNLAFGVIAYVVERVSGEPFAAYCRRTIFEPLKMAETNWYLREIDAHATPDALHLGRERKAARTDWGGLPQGVIREGGPTFDQKLENGYQPNCAYNHPELSRRLSAQQPERPQPLSARLSRGRRVRGRAHPQTRDDRRNADGAADARRTAAIRA